jgi:hypothetical protein
MSLVILTTVGVAISDRLPHVEEYNAFKNALLNIGILIVFCMFVAMILQLVLHLNEDHSKDFQALFLSIFALSTIIAGKITFHLSYPIDAFDKGAGLAATLLAICLLQYLYVRTAFGAGCIYIEDQIDWVFQGREQPEWLDSFLLSVVAGAAFPVILMIGSPNIQHLWFGGPYLVVVMVMYYLGLRFYTKNFSST